MGNSCCPSRSGMPLSSRQNHFVIATTLSTSALTMWSWKWAHSRASTRLLSKLAKKVYSFEPHPFNFRVAREELKRTWRSKMDNVTIQNIAIGREDSITTLKVRKRGESDSISSVAGIATVRYNDGVQVEARSLDSLGLCPDVLIADCEGSELDVLEGGRMALSKLKAAIIETHPMTGYNTKNQVEAWMEGRFSNVKVLSLSDEPDEVSWVMGLGTRPKVLEK